MRPGRGLIDLEIYNKLIEIPGASKIVRDNVTNHRLDLRSGKVRVEIHEEAWPEVKAMVQNLKRVEAGKPQVKFVPAPATPAPEVPEKPKKYNFYKGMMVKATFYNFFGRVVSESTAVVESVKGGIVRVKGFGRDLVFDVKTGEQRTSQFEPHREIVPLHEPVEQSLKKKK